MENSRAKLKRLIGSLVGVSCARAEVAVDGLRLVFQATPNRGVGWSAYVESHASSWRMLEAGAVLAGQHDCVDWERGIEAALDKFAGRVLTGLDLHPELPDVRFLLGDGLALEFFTTGRGDVAWSAQLPDATWVEIGPGPTWREVVKDAPSVPPSTEERRHINHAEACHERWHDRLPKRFGGDRCRACAYWQTLSGGFHFWDYGVCSNGQSRFDGKLVGARNGCPGFNAEIEIAGGEARYRDNLARVRALLTTEWDPIGIKELFKAPHDEYDRYAERALAMLVDEDADARALAKYLLWAETAMMGKPANDQVRERCERVAESLVALRPTLG